MATKVVLSMINVFSARDRAEKNAPLTDTACEGGRADLPEERPASLVDTPHPLPSSLYICLNTWGGDLMRGGGRMCVRIVAGLPRDPVPCRWYGGSRGVGAERTGPSPARLLEC